MAVSADALLAQALNERATPLRGEREDFDSLMELIGDARIVLLGEATHGTHEFYRQRTRITRRLIETKGFTAVAAEADWPDAYRVNRYVRGQGSDSDAEEALRDFQRFPPWMWRNADTLDLVGWLREHNDAVEDPSQCVGFYGLDLYSLHASMAAVLKYLDAVDPRAAERARARYACFEQFGEDAQAYGYAVSFGLNADCEREVIDQLMDLQQQSQQLLAHNGYVGADEYFASEQNARVVKSAEEYYRAMFEGQVSSWNLRDAHMADTLDALLTQLDRRGGNSKVVVWAHNSHVGDARATAMGAQGEWNIGQLMRERHGSDVRLIGFSTFSGTVTAASRWGGPAERKQVRPALPGSYEALFEQVGLPGFSLILSSLGEVTGALREERLQRAIGVLYLPRTERGSHYFHARVADQFDALVHIGHTRALEPLERTAGWEHGEAPETYPSGF